MTHNKHTIGNREWAACTSCGLKIKLLGSPQSQVYFMRAPSAQRRGFQCANCGQIVCFECSANRCRCICQSNAWVALPYVQVSEWLLRTHANTDVSASSKGKEAL